MRGKLIVMEGTDSSGKKTQVKILSDRLRAEGLKIETMSFPTYQNTKLGGLVSKYLNGEFGSKEQVGPEVGSMFFMMDRYQFRDKIRKALNSGINLITDRYTTSNIFQAAEAEGEERFRIWQWTKTVDSRMAQPDIVIFLNVPPEVSDRLFAHRTVKNPLIAKGGKDILERDKAYQERVRQLYHEIANKEGWIVIECCENNMLRKPEEIHEEIYRKLKERGVIQSDK